MSIQLPLPLPLLFLRTQAAARLIGVSARMLEKRRGNGTGPKYSKVGGRVIYATRDLEEWVKLSATTSTKINKVNPDQPFQGDEIITGAEAAWPAQVGTYEAALFLGLSHRTVEKHRSRGTGPKYSKVGRRIVYDVSDLREWIERNTKTSTIEPGETTGLPPMPGNKHGIALAGD